MLKSALKGSSNTQHGEVLMALRISIKQHRMIKFVLLSDVFLLLLYVSLCQVSFLLNVVAPYAPPSQPQSQDDSVRQGDQIGQFFANLATFGSSF